jgi:hypothetical protein
MSSNAKKTKLKTKLLLELTLYHKTETSQKGECPQGNGFVHKIGVPVRKKQDTAKKDPKQGDQMSL